MGADAYNIGADEHESHFVFDILFNNNTDIQPEIHSTDTHGTNEVNFALLHVFGYQFAPRYSYGWSIWFPGPDLLATPTWHSKN